MYNSWLAKTMAFLKLFLEDEYDVQDLPHALLLLYFDDVRAEEWTPSYAGKSARMDFLLKTRAWLLK